MNVKAYPLRFPEIKIDVVQARRRARKGHVAFDLGRHLTFSTAALESYAFAQWEPVIYDAMVVAAAIEYGDRTLKRSPRGWARRISLRIPVHVPSRWSAPDVSAALHDALGFLTGDYWTISFVKRSGLAPSPSQNYLQLPVKTQAVLAYSDGMDSRAVAGIEGATLGDQLVCVRVGSKGDRSRSKRKPFTAVPYAIAVSKTSKETSARSRGFKFALISGIAAYLTDAREIVIPESGQGAIGPALVAVAHAYPDYRNHPLFTKRMERFLNVLLGKPVRYVFPRLWNTKGETLREFAAIANSSAWATTKSCWRNSQWSSVNGKLRQCGVCAACMLRRVSVHAAGLTEQPDSYVCTDMSAATLRDAVDPDFKRWNAAFEEYAIAGVLHMDHLADMADEDARPAVRRHACLLGPALGLSPKDAEDRLAALLQRHAGEWKNYMGSLGARSFVRKWARTEQ
jgi:7-cyano-7-deazaguanine synthase in queuosine biosynthesis